MVDFKRIEDGDADYLLKEMEFVSIEDQAEHLTSFLLTEHMLERLMANQANEPFRTRMYNLFLSHLKVAEDRSK